MKIKNILIIGATSGIAGAVARRYATAGTCFVLVARQREKLEVVASDLVARGAVAAHMKVWEAAAPEQLQAVIGAAWQTLGEVDLVLIAHGTLPDQAKTETDLGYALEQFRVNGESAIACMLTAARYLESQGHGVMAVIGSVAGDRGRGSNYLYGAAKASVEACASGLRARLCKKGVHVLTIKPGFVATAMTAKLNLPAKLTAQPDQVARQIEQGIAAHKNVIYTPKFWMIIMLIIKLIPEFIFKKLEI